MIHYARAMAMPVNRILVNIVFNTRHIARDILFHG